MSNWVTSIMKLSVPSDSKKFPQVIARLGCLHNTEILKKMTLNPISYDEYTLLEQTAKYGKDAKKQKWFKERFNMSSKTVKSSIKILLGEKTKACSLAKTIARIFKEVETKNLQLKLLTEREKICETVDQAQKYALVKAMQEICDVLGISRTDSSPSDIVNNVRNLHATVSTIPHLSSLILKK